MLPTTSSLDAHRRRPGRPFGRSAALVASLLVLAACSSGGSEAKTTTTVQKDSGGEAGQPTTTETSEAPVGNFMPTDEDDAPSGSWIMVRYQTDQDPMTEDFVAGVTDVRLYSLEPSCDDNGCDVELTGDGEDGSFTLPGLEKLDGEPVALEAGPDGWVHEEDVEPYGCSADLEGPYVTSHDTRSFSPVRDDNGKITALVGQDEFDTEITSEGESAGCDMGDIVYRYRTVMVPEDGIGGPLDFEADGKYLQALNIVDSTGFSEPMFQAGGQPVTFSNFALSLDGRCQDDECDVSVTIPAPGKTIETEMTVTDEETIAVDQTGTGGCYDPDTGNLVFADGAYDVSGGIVEMTPLWVVDGEAKIFIGRLETTSTPTTLGQTEPACSTEQALEAWAIWLSVDLIDEG